MYIYKNLVITIEHYIKFIISKTLKLELKKKKKKKKKKNKKKKKKKKKKKSLFIIDPKNVSQFF